MASEQIGELAAAATALLWTLSALVWTSAGRHTDSLSVGLLRLVMACPMLATHALLARHLVVPSDVGLPTWWLMGLSGFMGFFLADVCLFQAFVWIGPRLSLLLQALAPPLTAILSWLWLSERLETLQWLAMAVTLGGIVWVVLEQPQAGPLALPSRHRRLGLLLAAAGAVGQAVAFVLARKARDFGPFDPVAATQIRIFGALLGYPVLVTLARRWPSVVSTGSNRRVMGILLLGTIVGPYLGVVAMMTALGSECPTGVVTTIVNTTPILILPFSVLLHGERIGLRAVAGAVVSVAGVALLVLAPGATPRPAPVEPRGPAQASAMPTITQTLPQAHSNGMQMGVTCRGKLIECDLPRTTVGSPRLSSRWASWALALPAIMFVSSPTASIVSEFISAGRSPSMTPAAPRAAFWLRLKTAIPFTLPDMPITPLTS